MRMLPTAPLGPVALGQSDLFPSQYDVTNQSSVVFMNPSDIESPWHLMSGHFDLAFVIVYLLPLLIFALSYNLLSAERENGTLRLLLSQPLRLRTLLAGKLSVRAAVLLGPAVLLPVAVLLVARHAGTTTGWAVSGDAGRAPRSGGRCWWARTRCSGSRWWWR
jgi:ABC-2 type transport system permease protein